MWLEQFNSSIFPVFLFDFIIFRMHFQVIFGLYATFSDMESILVFFPLCFSMMNQRKERNIKRIQQQRELASVGLGTARYNNKTMSTFLSLSLSPFPALCIALFIHSVLRFLLFVSSLAVFSRRLSPLVFLQCFKIRLGFSVVFHYFVFV